MTIDWNEVILLGIGTAFGLFSSLAIMFIQKLVQSCGKVRIYYKFSLIPDALSGWGFTGTENGGLGLRIPAFFEFQNTTEMNKVCRDVDLLIYADRKCIGRLTQITHQTGSNAKEFGDKKSYSFVLPPRSVQKFECLFTLNISRNEVESKKFNIIKLSYFDEHNRKHIRDVREMVGNWELATFPPDNEWEEIK